jgi:hypothetical protein
MPGLVLPLIAVTLFKQALLAGLSALGGKAASAFLLEPLMTRITHARIMSAIGKSYDTAFKQFTHKVGNTSLIMALSGDPMFWEDPALHQTLATAIIYPERRHDCVADLERRFAQVVPTQPAHLVHAAAKCLLDCLRESVLSVTAFQRGLTYLRDAVGDTGTWLNSVTLRDGQRGASLPPFAHGLEADLARLAEDEAMQCGHNYVGTAHLLLALADLPDSAAAGILADARLDGGTLRPVVIRVVRSQRSAPADNSPPRRPLPVTESVRKAYHMARVGAERAEMDETKDEQVLEALLDMVDLGQEGGQSVAQVLRQTGVGVAALRGPLNQFVSLLQTLSY